jgi:CNT family concentrative nucleoside transporter
MFPETEGEAVDEEQANVRAVRDTESANVIDAIGRGALSGGRVAVIVAALLIGFISLIAMANGILSGIGGWFGYDDLTFQKVMGWAFSPVAWLIGVPWSEAAQSGGYIGEKTVLNEFVAFASFGPHVKELSEKTVLVTTFALAGFANFSSIAIQIGTLGGLAPERRAEVARFGLKALLAGTLVNLSNAAIAGIVAG